MSGESTNTKYDERLINQKCAEVQLRSTRETEAIMKCLLENTESALTLLDLGGNLKYYNNVLRQIIGYGFEEIDQMLLLKIIGEKNLKDLQDAISQISADKSSMHLLDVIVRHRAGDARVVSIKLNYFDVDGEGRILVSIDDITEESKRQEEIRQLSRMKDVVLAINHKLSEDVNLDDYFDYILSRVSEVMPHADLGCILMLDEEGYLSMASSFGYLQEENCNFRLPLKESFAYRTTGEDYKRTVIINNIQTLLNPGYVEIMDNKDGYLVQSSISGPIFKDNKLYGLINIDSKENDVYTENDIAIMEYLREQLGLALSHRELFRQNAFLSKHDQLTGFHNRWYLEELENDHVPRWRRYATDIQMVAMDLNDLKKVNDEYGHHEGDNYIISYSKSMQRVFRSTDLFIRLGGDEFAGIFFHISDQELISKLDEVNQAIADSDIQKKAHNLKLGFAYGIVRFGEPSFNIHEIMQIADGEMYSHKSGVKAGQCAIL
jgi:diguanylate cyclase (GGDEF)-like protein/PAS domain S-box-containing protein